MREKKASLPTLFGKDAIFSFFVGLDLELTPRSIIFNKGDKIV